MAQEQGRGRTKYRGFASLPAEKVKEIASMGGKAAHKKGAAHVWNSEEAQAAGRKGGMVSRGGRRRFLEGQDRDGGHGGGK